MTATDGVILMTAFEPSGDALGAVMAQELFKRRPGIKIVALGGPKMRAAGVEIIEETTGKAVMLLGAVSQAWTHWQRLQRLKAWLVGKKVLAHIPVDSPAANWSICGAVRAHDMNTPITHLVAPQLWAWAPWRIKKLKRLTNHVLCLLPFEPDWFGARGVKGTFVGHPMFDAHAGRTDAYSHHLPGAVAGQDALAELPDPGWPGLRLALLPGSRPGEWAKNWPTMVSAFKALKAKHPGLQGVIASYDEKADQTLRGMTQKLTGVAGLPEGMSSVIKRTQEVLAWSDVVLVVSGTATLEVAMHQKPMVAIYNTGRLGWVAVGQFVVKTRTFTLPNIIAEWKLGHRAVTELVPHFGAVEPLVARLDRLIGDSNARHEEIERLDKVCEAFKGVSFIEKAPEVFLRVTGL
jgi:lipid-A-disaccharide synthase